jgi:uncharacterized membrane protein YgcG
MKQLLLSSIALLLCLGPTTGCRSTAVSQVNGDFHTSKDSAQERACPLPAPNGLVNDYANVLNQEEQDRLEAALSEFKSRSKIDIAVVTVRSTGNEPIFDYSLAVARGWKVAQQIPTRQAP